MTSLTSSGPRLATRPVAFAIALVLAVTLLLAAATERAHAAKVTCPSTFRVLHNDTIGKLKLAKGALQGHGQERQPAQLRRRLRPVPAVPRGLRRQAARRLADPCPAPGVLPAANQRRLHRQGDDPPERRRRGRRSPPDGQRLPQPLHGPEQRPDRQAPPSRRSVPDHAAGAQPVELPACLEAVRQVPPGLHRQAPEPVAARRRDGDVLEAPQLRLPGQAGQMRSVPARRGPMR